MLTRKLGFDTMTKHLQITSEVVTITPQIASLWLDKFNNPNNRKIYEDRVKNYAQRIVRGEWLLGDALKFDKNGVLIDGQHRLSAVIHTNQPVQFLVLRGFEPESAQVLDRGMLRSLSHVAQLSGHEWITQKKVSIFNSLFFSFCDSRSSILKLTDDQKIKGIVSCKEGLSLASYNGTGSGKRINSSQLSAVIVRAFYSEQTPLIYYKSTRKKWDSSILKDFLLLVQGHTYCGSSNKFSQTELNYSAPLLLREMFTTNSFSKAYDKESDAFRKIRFKMCESALYKYLSNANVKRLHSISDNLFPVSWIDDLTFNKPN